MSGQVKLGFHDKRDAWMWGVYASKLGDVAKLALGTLFLRFNFEDFEKDGRLVCFPAVKRIAMDIRRKEGAVRRGLNRAVRLGYIRKHMEFNREMGKWKSNRYEALWPPQPPKEEIASPTFARNGKGVFTGRDTVSTDRGVLSVETGGTVCRDRGV